MEVSSEVDEDWNNVVEYIYNDILDHFKTDFDTFINEEQRRLGFKTT